MIVIHFVYPKQTECNLSFYTKVVWLLLELIGAQGSLELQQISR